MEYLIYEFIERAHLGKEDRLRVSRPPPIKGSLRRSSGCSDQTEETTVRTPLLARSRSPTPSLVSDCDSDDCDSDDGSEEDEWCSWCLEALPQSQHIRKAASKGLHRSCSCPSSPRSVDGSTQRSSPTEVEMSTDQVASTIPPLLSSTSGACSFPDADEAKDAGEEGENSAKEQNCAAPPGSSASGEASSKRSHNKFENTDGKGNGFGGKLRKLNPKPGSGASKMRLACVYHKYRPFMYRKTDLTGKLYETCATRDFENINRLFEHIERNHCESPNQCPTCGVCFVDNQDDYRFHINARLCERKPFTEVEFATPRRINNIKADLRRDLLNRRDNEESKWFYVFQCLFKEHSSPPDPYLGDPSTTVLSLVEEFVVSRIRQLPSDASLNSQQLQHLVPGFFRDFRNCHGLMVSEHSEPPASRDLQPTGPAAARSSIAPLDAITRNSSPVFHNTVQEGRQPEKLSLPAIAEVNEPTLITQTGEGEVALDKGFVSEGVPDDAHRQQWDPWYTRGRTDTNNQSVQHLSLLEGTSGEDDFMSGPFSILPEDTLLEADFTLGPYSRMIVTPLL